MEKVLAKVHATTSDVDVKPYLKDYEILKSSQPM